MPRNSVVLDASMAVAWAFDDEHTPSILAALHWVADVGAIVPSLWRLEVANAFRSAVRRKRCDNAFVDAALALLERTVIEVDHETDAHAWGETMRLSRQHDLTPYDAAYLELALRRQSALATTGQSLKTAAAKHDVALVG